MPKTDRVELIGVPFGAGQRLDGVELGPDALRNAGLTAILARAGWQVGDRGNIIIRESDVREVSKPSFNEQALIAETGRQVADAVSRVLNSGAASLQIGGDHGIAIGTVAGALRAYPDLRVIWVDAHGDSNTPETSPTGNFHGMPLAALMGLFPIRDLPGFEWLKEVLRPDRVALVGVRDLDAGEKRLIEKLGVQSHSAHEVRERGAASVIEECLRKLDPDGNSPIHYSLDIDAMDPGVASATGLPVPEGLSLEEIETIGHTLALTGRLVAMDLVEINPLCGDSMSRELTLRTGIRAVLSALGKGRAHHFLQGESDRQTA